MKTIITLLLLFVVTTVSSQHVVTIKGKQPYPNTNWDLVHGILGSKELNDDLEQRVSDKLSQLKMGGNYSVTNIKIQSYKNRGYIHTKATVYINESTDGKSYTVFTTRGSIGHDYIKRHDKQVLGLSKRLSDYYNGTVKTFGPYEVCVSDENGDCFIKYKQSFYCVGK